jgi:polysaccharide lyase-like protein
MGRHRHTGLPRAQQAALLATGTVTSHRRARSSPRARSAAVLAVGVLASGVVITAATTSWFQDAALPGPRTAEPAARPADRPDAGPAPTAPAPAPAVGTAPTAPSAPPASPAVLWRGDDDGAFRPTPWNTVGAAPPQVVGRQVSVHLTGRGQRSELEPDLPALGEGDRHDVTFSLCLGHAFPVHLTDRQVIARWENDGPGPAPLDLRVRGGALVLHGGEGHPSGWRSFDHSLGPVPTGQWVDVALRVHFSANADQAQVSAWRDGERVLSDHHPPGGTLYPGQQSYLKVGLHRDVAIAAPAAVHIRDAKIVQSRAAAHPDRRAAASRSTAGHLSVPQQRSASSSTAKSSSGPRSSSPPKHRAAEHVATAREATAREATAREATAREATVHGATQHESTQHESTQHRSAAATSPRSASHGSVPRNTPSHVAASHGGSTGSRR